MEIHAIYVAGNGKDICAKTMEHSGFQYHIGKGKVPKNVQTVFAGVSRMTQYL